MDKYAPTGNVLNDFINGCRKGMQMALFNQTPNFIMAYALIEILNITGIMPLITNALNPVMGLFGLPGQAGFCIVTSWLSLPGGIAAMAKFVASGVFTGVHVAILLPMLYFVAGQIQFTGRILTLTKTPTRYFFPTYIIGFITAIVMGLLIRVLVGILF